MSVTYWLFDPFKNRQTANRISRDGDRWAVTLEKGSAAGLVVQASRGRRDRIYLTISPDRATAIAVAAKEQRRNVEIWAVLRSDFDFSRFPVIMGTYVLLLQPGFEQMTIAQAQAMAARGHGVAILDVHSALDGEPVPVRELSEDELIAAVMRDRDQDEEAEAEGKALRQLAAALIAAERKAEPESPIADEPRPLRRALRDQCVRLLLDHKDFRGLLGLDRFSGNVLLMRPSSMIESGVFPRPLEDIDATEIVRRIEQLGYGPSMETVELSIAVAARCNAFDPLVDFFDRLPAWDGTRRIDDLFQIYLGTDPGDMAIPIEDAHRLLAAIARVLCLGIVARVYRPGSKSDHMVVLEGDQGLGKSSFAAALAFDMPDWFTDGLNSDLGARDTLLHLSGKLVVEMSELSALKKTGIEETKRFISKRVDRYRQFYARREIAVPRRCVFIGTTNAADYLLDVTGNRRFLPVMARAVDLEGFRIDRAQIFAEAIARYRAGEPWWLDPEETRLAEIEQLARLQDDAWEEPLRRSIGDNRHLSRGDLFVTVTDGFNWLGIDISKRNKSEYDRIARILRKVGGEPQQRQTRAGRHRGFYFPAIAKPEG